MYNTKKVVDTITPDRILRIVSELQIYNFYAGKKVELNKPISSPLRKDANPSFALFIAKNNSIMWKDFTTGESGNVFKFVQTMLHLTFYETLKQVWNDLILNGTVTPRPKYNFKPTPRKSVIGIQRKYFTHTDDEYWGQYGIGRDLLKEYNVTPIHRFWVNDIEQPFKYTKDCPMYAYKIYDKFKIYRPLSTNKSDKWRNNCNSYDMQGFEQLPESGDLLIITKSLKDVMVLNTFGYAAVSPQSETSTIPKIIFEHLKERFKKIVVFFDYDEGGITGADKLCEKYNIKSVFIPKHYLDIYGIKDISDFCKDFTPEKTKELLKEIFDEKRI